MEESGTILKKRVDTMPDDASYADFLTDVAAASTAPLWERFNGEMPVEPVPMPPFVWRWSEISPLTERAAREVPMEDVERRVLTLRNPHLDSDRLGTTVNLVGAIQTLLPGETAVSHRHSGNALRFVLEGQGAETLVDGKHCPMEERDMILTPAQSWHGHVHNGDQRIVWFDALDIPLFRNMNATFFEEGPPPNLPPQTPDAAFAAGGLTPDTGDAAPRYSPLFRWSWASVEATLAEMPAAKDGSKRLRYTNPMTGGPAMSLMDCYVLALAKGAATVPRRSTSDVLCVAAGGEGATQIGDQRIEWSRNDIFTMPGWNWISHTATSDHARLFLVTDRDVMQRLGMLRDEVKDDARV